MPTQIESIQLIAAAAGANLLVDAPLFRTHRLKSCPTNPDSCRLQRPQDGIEVADFLWIEWGDPEAFVGFRADQPFFLQAQ